METVTFYLPSRAKHEQVGPSYQLRREPGVESDIVHDIKDLLEHPPQRLGETAWWIEPPEISYDYVLVLVRHPGSGIAAYVVQMAKETMSLEGIRAYINDMYGPNAVDGESLQASNNLCQGEAYPSGSVLFASPPSQPPPIKPDDNQPVVHPAEESPPDSFDSARSFGACDSQTARVTTAESFAVADPTGRGQLQAPHNRPFPDFHSCGEGDKGMDIESRDQDSRISELLEGEDIYRKSHDEIRLPNPPPLGLTQDLVVGIAPLKLRQNPPLVALPPTTNNEKDDDLKGSLGECEYRSLQLEGLKFAEEEKGGGKESASFPLTYGRRLEAAKIRLHHQISEKRELISSPHQTETNREEGPACRELQQKVHILEHVYNQECFLKGQCKNVPSPEALQEMSEMTKAHRDGKLDPKASDLLKQYIAAHCQRCCDPNCKIPHMAAGCPQPGMLPETVERDFSQSTTTDHTQQSPTASIPKHVQEPQKFTDGRRLFTQATDDVVPSQGNRMYVGLAIARPHQSEDGSTPKTVYTGNHVIHAQATNSEERPLQTLESLQNGCFPSVDTCRRCQLDSQNLIKKLIYCSEQFTESTGCQFGSSVAGSLRISERLGKGGNGCVYKCCLCSRNNVGEACCCCKLAAKLTHYRQRELCIWSKLKHENVTALHGVVLVPLYCGGVRIYQLMPLMTSTFQKEVNCVGNLHSLIWEKKMSSHTVTKNMHHICREIAKGLCYLHSNHIYHGDLKGSNIFICKQSGCQCVSTFLCMCPPHLKSQVYIGDFDSANYHTPGCDGDQIDGRIKIVRSGTMFYRSPEAHIGYMGPWCDLWSIGCIIVYSILGHTNISMKPMAKELNRDPSALYQYNPLHVLLFEAVNASRQEQLLLSLCKENPEPGFIHLSMIAEACLNINFHKRITADELYHECLRL